ncbi:MAG: EamA family transporter [Rhodocyclaceae bacterium]|nr:EamA family transporter [Rhodocyclaceae bacterium]
MAALLLLWLIWGYNWVVMKRVVDFADPLDFSALRALFGALTLFATLLVLRRPLRPVRVPGLLLMGLLQNTAFLALIQMALVSGAAGRTAVLVYTMPFWLLPLAWLTLGERIRGLQWLAIAMAAVGLALVVGPAGFGGSLQGSGLALAAGLCWAVATIVARRLGIQQGADLLLLTAWQMLFGAIALCVIAWLVPSRPIEWSDYLVGALVYNAVPATALAWILWLFVVRSLPAGAAGLSSLGIPLVGVLAGAIELGERPPLSELLGMGLILAALAVIGLRALFSRPPASG